MKRDHPGHAQDERRGLQDGVCAGEQGKGVWATGHFNIGVSDAGKTLVGMNA